MFSSPLVMGFINSALVPAIVSTVLLFLVGGMKDPLRGRLQGVVLALAFLYGGYVLVGRIQFPPHDVSEGLMWGGLILGLFALWNPKPLGPRYLVRALFVLAVGAAVFYPIHTTILKPMYYRNLVAFFCLGLGIWSITERTAGAVRPVTLMLLPLIAATGTSFMLLFHASAVLANQTTVLCALIGGMAVLGYLFPKRLALGGIFPFISLLIVTLIAVGHFYLDVNPWHMIVMCIPFGVLWVREWLKFVPEHPVLEPLILALVSAAPLAYFLFGVFKESGPLF
jgi:hypothetical protein